MPSTDFRNKICQNRTHAPQHRWENMLIAPGQDLTNLWFKSRNYIFIVP